MKNTQNKISIQTQEQIESELKSRDYLYKQCIDIRNFEIGNLVNRNNFFMIFQGVLMAGFLQASAAAPKPIVMLVVSVFGFVISIFQTGMSSGAKFWQTAWEFRLSETEIMLRNTTNKIDPKKDFYDLFSEDIQEIETKVRGRLEEEGCFSALFVRRFSVSKIPIYCGILLMLVWAVLGCFYYRIHV